MDDKDSILNGDGPSGVRGSVALERAVIDLHTGTAPSTDSSALAIPVRSSGAIRKEYRVVDLHIGTIGINSAALSGFIRDETRGMDLHICTFPSINSASLSLSHRNIVNLERPAARPAKEAPVLSSIKYLSISHYDKLLVSEKDLANVRPHHKSVAQSHCPTRVTGSLHCCPIGNFGQPARHDNSSGIL
jgi:hypothetical protein